MGPGTLRLVRTLFKNYYSSAEVSVGDLGSREFGFQFFEAEGMVRHLSFRGPDELRRFLVTRVPMHVYHSVALYREPGNQDMESKGWLGADLVFDIDGDHLPTEACRGAVLMTLECLSDAMEELNKLLDILTEEFGLSNMEIYFSGHRGFHVHIGDPEVRGLGQEERGEIVDYLLLRNFNMDHFLRGRVPLGMDMRGTGGRVAAALHEVDPGAVGRGRARGLRRLGPRLIEKLITHIDEVVTMDVHRLIRMPNSLHGKTGLRVTKLSPSELERGVEYVVDKAVVFRRGSLTIRLRERPPVRRVLGEVIDGDVAKLPTYLAVYLLMSGWGELIDR